MQSLSRLTRSDIYSIFSTNTIWNCVAFRAKQFMGFGREWKRESGVHQGSGIHGEGEGHDEARG